MIKKLLLFFTLITCLIHSIATKNFEPIQIQNNEDKNFDVVSVDSVEILKTIPKELGFDYRVNSEDTEESCSFLKGIALDLEHVRSQIFIIKDGSSVIGMATLIATPFKYLNKKGFLQLDAGKIVLKSIKEILDINDSNTLILEVGWFHILPKYRNEKLGSSFVSKVLTAAIQNLVSIVFKDKKIFIVCSAKGCADMKMRKSFGKAWKKHLEEKSDGTISVPDNLLGKVDPQSQFTSIIAQRLHFEPLQIYNFSLGPVFIKRSNRKLSK
jgi:hypothetical protein